MFLHLSVSHSVRSSEGASQHAMGRVVSLPKGCLPTGCLPRLVSAQGGVYQVGVYIQVEYLPRRCLPKEMSVQGCVYPGGVSA